MKKHVSIKLIPILIGLLTLFAIRLWADIEADVESECAKLKASISEPYKVYFPDVIDPMDSINRMYTLEAAAEYCRSTNREFKNTFPALWKTQRLIYAGPLSPGGKWGIIFKSMSGGGASDPLKLRLIKVPRLKSEEQDVPDLETENSKGMTQYSQLIVTNAGGNIQIEATVDGRPLETSAPPERVEFTRSRAIWRVRNERFEEIFYQREVLPFSKWSGLPPD